MKTPEEIKKGLKFLGTTNVTEKVELASQGLAYAYYEDFAADTLAYIRQLENQIGELTEKVAQLEAARPKWISVKERLPEAYDDGSVDAVIVTDGSFIHMAYFSCGKWHFCESGEMKEKMFYSVTHWMPLPEPPKDKEGR